MKYEDFVGELAAAGISGRELGRLLRLSPSTIANYKSKGEVPSNLAVIAVLMRLLEENRIEFRQQIEGLDIQPNAPRGRPL